MPAVDTYRGISREYEWSKELPFRRLPDESTFGVDNYYLSTQTHVRAFEEAGLSGFGWCDLVLDDSDPDYPPAYWDLFRQGQPVIGVRARG